MKSLLRGYDVGPYVRFTAREMFGHWMYPGGAYLGHLRPEYPGTDALSLSVAPHARAWLETLPEDLERIYGEGTRLSHLGFLAPLSEKTDLTVVYLSADPAALVQRRAQRSGKVLSEHYCKVAATRAANAATDCEAAGIRVLRVESAGSPDDVAERCLR
jgi:hypothetical protein